MGKIQSQNKSDPFASRRKKPRVIIPNNFSQNKKNSFLVSGNLDYFIRYGLALISSYLNNNITDVSLIINCVDFPMKVGYNLLAKYFEPAKLSSIYLVKTDLEPLGLLTPNQRLSYLKTIRFYVALNLRQKFDFNLIICDIDCLVTTQNFQFLYKELVDSGTTLGIGSVYDYLGKGLHDASLKNYLWRTIKAGFTFFKHGDNGTEALKRITQCLFSYEDPIPPVDELKLYRAYYGDQLAILFTSLELDAAPAEMGHSIKCIGHNHNQIVTFGSDPKKGSLWIPPASKRDENLFSIDKL